MFVLATLALALDTLPPHLRGGAVWQSFPAVDEGKNAAGPHYIDVLLDHQRPIEGHWSLKYYGAPRSS